MAGISEAEIAGVNLRYYEKLYRELNPSGSGDIPAGPAAEFLKGSGLQISDLSVIWEVADYRRRGALDKQGIFIALKLVAAVQQGHSTNIDLKMPLNPPSFPNIPPSVRPSPAVTPGPFEWDISASEQTKYDAIFNSLGPVNGKLSGEKVRPVMMNSGLSNVQLAKIWEMSDLDKDGMLDQFEMSIAMHLIYKCIETHALPDRLPPALARRSSVASSRRASAVASPVGSRIVPPLTSNSRTSSITSLNRGETRSQASIHSVEAPAPPSGSQTPVGVPRPGMKSIFDPTITDFPIDVARWQEDFEKLDTDHDGYLSGLDCRAALMATGLPQQQLAQIWGLVDIVKTGRLNSEQFALTMELIKEARLGVKLPEILPAQLIPPSLRASMPHMPLSPSEKANPRVRELNEEIETIIANRRQADQDLAQLEADITVKNSTVKNLEIELNTLQATVNQLRNQKGEAEKRLGEMDNRIVAFGDSVEEAKKRLASEEERLRKTKEEVEIARENANAEEQIMYSVREELRTLDNTLYQKKVELNKATDGITKATTQLADMESRITSNATEVVNVRAKLEELKAALEELERAQSPTSDDPILLKRYDELNADGKPAVAASASSAHAFQTSFDQSFGQETHPVAHVDPFANASTDPFGSGSFDAFGQMKISSPRATAADPFAQADPFSSAPAVPTSNNFADFANFASFN
uniref:Epidermal growth factor receptor substrate 15-like 1 n=1 Tax=Panagrellus redivivus TaxID=6233 RepID=A0A7E4VA08_PANRE